MNIGNFQVSRHFIIIVSIIVIFAGYNKFTQWSQQREINQYIENKKHHKAKLIASIDELTILDPNLRTCIEQKTAENAEFFPLGDQQPAALQHANEIKILYCSGRKINSLAGLENFHQLQYIDIANNNIRDLTPLASLPSLESLSISHNPIKSIKILTTLPKLKSVTLPRLKHLTCSYIKTQLDGIKTNLSYTGCKKPTTKTAVSRQPQKKNTDKKSKPLSGSEERELFEYEQHYQ